MVGQMDGEADRERVRMMVGWGDGDVAGMTVAKMVWSMAVAWAD